MPMNTSAKCIIVNERASVDFATPPSCASLLQSTQRTQKRWSLPGTSKCFGSPIRIQEDGEYNRVAH
jgi:hypothetical protein